MYSFQPANPPRLILGPAPCHDCGTLLFYGVNRTRFKGWYERRGLRHDCPGRQAESPQRNASMMEQVRERIAERLPPRADVLPRGGRPMPARDVLESYCPCGGDASAPMHDQSLTHSSWMRRMEVQK